MCCDLESNAVAALVPVYLVLTVVGKGDDGGLPPFDVVEVNGEASVCELVDGEDGRCLCWKDVNVVDGGVIAVVE